MEKKNWVIILLTTIFIFTFLATPVYAGAKNRYLWEGVAIGVGAAILGHAIISSTCGPYSAGVHVYSGPPPVYYPPPVYCVPPSVYYVVPPPPAVYYGPPPYSNGPCVKYSPHHHRYR
jgi:hypothetical protein